MSKKEFIKKFNLVKGERNYFWDGRTRIERIVYHNENSSYIFLNGDMYGVNEERHTIQAGYSWYH